LLPISITIFPNLFKHDDRQIICISSARNYVIPLAEICQVIDCSKNQGKQ
jgi:hypothetical protein